MHSPSSDSEPEELERMAPSSYNEENVYTEEDTEVSEAGTSGDEVRIVP